MGPARKEIEGDLIRGADMQQTTVTGRTRDLVIGVDRFTQWISCHWLAAFIAIYGAWVIVPFFAPLFMEAGATAPAQGIYAIYSFFCHQLPQRSLFFGGPKVMYSLATIKSVWPKDGFEGLRGFIGNPQMGYKMAWSDRMISFYGSVWVGALIFAFLRKRLRSLPTLAWILFGLVPVGIDGGTHFINDILAGTSGTGFRDTNAWLQLLTGNAFPQWFYVGDALGSFNSDMRWITGILFGLTTVWFLFPMIEREMRAVQMEVAVQLERARRGSSAG